jgi:hypothetical protein
MKKARCSPEMPPLDLDYTIATSQEIKRVLQDNRVKRQIMLAAERWSGIRG